MSGLQPLDYLAIALYMALMAGMGMVLGALIQDISAYFKGGGTVPWVAAAISNYMSMFSAFIAVLQQLEGVTGVIVPFTKDPVITRRVIDAGRSLRLVGTTYGGTRQNSMTATPWGAG